MENFCRTCRNNRNLCCFLPGDKKIADKTAPVLVSRNGPQHSLSLNLICLCPAAWPPFLESVSGPQNGGRFCRRNSSHYAKNSASFDCFRGYATKVWHTAGRSMVLQRREHLFSTPCEHLCPHMFLNWGARETGFASVFGPQNEGHNSPENAIYLWTHQWPNPCPSLC